MIEILSHNLFHALNNHNETLLKYLLDEDCLLTNFKAKSVLGKEKVISELDNLYHNYHLDIINTVKDDQNTLLIAYKLSNEQEKTFGSLLVRKNDNQKISLLKNMIINNDD